MKINKIYEKFKNGEDNFKCPICNKDIRLNDNGSFICLNRHCFDLSSKGYMNFIPNQKHIKYNKDLFENRKMIFDDGFYNNVLIEIENDILKYSKNKEVTNILDAGCGEGYYSLQLDASNKLKSNIFAMDIVKDAIKIASRKQSSVKWMVGDITNIPLKENSVDVLVNILTPSRYSEFKRVLSKNGVVIKVIPGDEYLKEIRSSISGQLKNKSYSNKRVIDYFKDNIMFVESKRVKYRLPVSKQQLICFLEMTPMTFGVDTSKANIGNIQCITIDLEILVGINK